VDQPADNVRKFVLAVRNLQTVKLRRRIEAIEVSIEPKNCRAINSLITTNSFEHTAAVVKRMTRYMRRCILPVNELTVFPNPFGFNQTHDALLSG